MVKDDAGELGESDRQQREIDAADAALFLLGTEPVRALLARADLTSVASARDALTATLAPYQTPDGVQLRGAHWLVSATRPTHPAEPPHL